MPNGTVVSVQSAYASVRPIQIWSRKRGRARFPSDEPRGLLVHLEDTDLIGRQDDATTADAGPAWHTGGGDQRLLADVMARKLPGSTVNSIGAIYAHTIFGEEGLLNGLVRGGTPVYFSGGWAPKVGIDMPQGGLEPDWAPSLDLGVFRQYAAAVHESMDEYLASASEADLDRIVDPGFTPPMPV